MISGYTVDLFRHCPVKAPQPRFDMSDRNMELCCRQCTCKCRVGITVDHNPVWTLFQEHSLDRLEHTSCLSSMRPRAYPQVVVRRWNSKFIEELGRHVIIVVLPCMNNEFFVSLPYRATYWRKLHELRSCPHYRCNSHYSPPLWSMEEITGCL